LCVCLFVCPHQGPEWFVCIGETQPVAKVSNWVSEAIHTHVSFPHRLSVCARPSRHTHTHGLEPCAFFFFFFFFGQGGGGDLLVSGRVFFPSVICRCPLLDSSVLLGVWTMVGEVLPPHIRLGWHCRTHSNHYTIRTDIHIELEFGQMVVCCCASRISCAACAVCLGHIFTSNFLYCIPTLSWCVG
jgi:hypothetical protein